MTKARDLSKLLSTANGKIEGANLDVSFENITDTGTEGTRVATGTNEQQGSTAGQFRFNTTTGKFEGYNGSSFKTIENNPTISSVSPSNFESSQLPQNIVITGTNFSAGDLVNFIGADNTSTASPTVVVNSDTQITAQIPNTITSANEPYTVKITNAGGLTTQLEGAFNIDAAPEFSIASGSLGTLPFTDRSASNLNTITATDDENDTITFTVTSGSLPNGITLNSNGTWSGTADEVQSDTTYTFTVTASDGNNSTTRQYTMLVKSATIVAFTSNSSWSVPGGVTSATVLIVAGGGGGGSAAGQGRRGAGGGAGGLIYIPSWDLTGSGSYTITVGNGGGVQSNGQNSSISGGSKTLTAIGGGHGDEADPGYGYSSTSGGSGGAGFGGTNTGSAGTQTVNTSDGVNTYNNTGYGNNGGDGYGDNPYAGGGGGAGGAGQNAIDVNSSGYNLASTDELGNTLYGNSVQAIGGPGKYFSIFSAYGESGFFASGGTGAGFTAAASHAHLGGGGIGNNTVATSNNSSADAQTNTGGGGGSAGNGGSGIVLIAY